MFKEMEEVFKEQVHSLVSSIHTEGAEARVREDVHEPRETLITSHNEPKSNTANTDQKKDIGRNDPCYCGSGKKFKKCHGK